MNRVEILRKLRNIGHDYRQSKNVTRWTHRFKCRETQWFEFLATSKRQEFVAAAIIAGIFVIARRVDNG